ncbi:MAG: STAS domain-containing protein, partial [Steroidobacteraceae bacterium]
MYFNARSDAGQLRLDLTGAWRLAALPELEPALAELNLRGARRLLVAAGGLESLDISGAWALRQLIERARGAGAEVAFEGGAPEQLRLLQQTLSA